MSRPVLRPTTPVAVDRRSPLPGLTGLRWLAALPVFAFHLSLVDFGLNPFADGRWARTYASLLGQGGWTGVSFFFVLSGFLLTWRCSESRGTAAFVRKRLAKIFPLHVVTWSVAMVLYAFALAGSPWEYLPNLVLVSSWIPVHDVYLSVNLPSWSLCSELLFYLSFPALVPLVRRLRADRLALALAACVAGTVVVALVTMSLPDGPGVDGMPVTNLQFWFGYNLPLPRLLEFVAGMLLARLVAERRVPTIAPWVAWTAVLVGYVVASLGPFVLGFVAVMLVPLMMVVVATVQRDLAGRGTWVSSRPMVWLGEVSFGFYMAQQIVMYTVRITWQHGATYPVPLAIADWLLVFALTLGFATALHRLVEEPAMRRLGTRRQARAAAAAVAR
ncbi:acyltransferase [Aeromicrobium sp. REDSEA-S38_B2]|uniref:acyltransferase family protein n=1 Tax=Aeromicrobium sp. REDSEA-S38_B2 TaxID=1811528 RepID=UPI00257DC77F|nr:acyltransferase [Aeromicrobium sp. REDSEA-S38_B2]